MAENRHDSVEALLEHGAWVRALARALLRDAHLADDLVQDVWLGAVRNPPRAGDEPRPWFRRVARNLAARVHRAALLRERHERRDAHLRADPPTPEEILDRAERYRWLVEKVIALREPYRRTLLYRFFEELSTDEIAARLGVPAATVRTRLKRGLAELRENLGTDSRDRRAWILALLPVADLRPAPLVSSLVGMGGLVKAKIVAAVIVIAGILWLVMGGGLDTRREAVIAPAAESSAPLATNTGSAAPPAVSAKTASRAADERAPIMVRGRVLHAVTAAPIAGALVRVISWDIDWTFDAEPLDEASTDANGEFAFSCRDLKSRRRGAIEVRCDGFLTERQPAWGESSGDCRTTIYLVPGFRVRGEVVANDGSRITGGHVALHDRVGFGRTGTPGLRPSVDGARYRDNPINPPNPAAIEIDEAGRFSFFATAGLIALEARVPGFAPAYGAPVEVGPGETPFVQIRVDRGTTLRGIVVDEEGVPVSGARIAAEPVLRSTEPDSLFERHHVLLAAACGADGSFTVLDTTGAVKSIRVEHSDYLPSTIENGPYSSGGDPVRVTLSRGQVLAGRMVLADGAPLAHTYVWVTASPQLWFGFHTDENGAFRTDPFAAEHQRALFDARDALPVDVTWQGGPGVHDVGAVSVFVGMTVSVHVSNQAQQPVEGATVALNSTDYLSVYDTLSTSSPAARTNAAGVAILRGVAAGEYNLGAIDEKGRRAVRLVAIPGDGALELELRDSAHVVLQVCDTDGKPVSGVRAGLEMRAAQRDSNTFFGMINARSSISDEQGRMAFHGLDASVSGIFLQPRDLPILAVPLLPLAPGEERDLGVITLDPGCSLEGCVRTESGEPVAGVWIQAYVGRQWPVCSSKEMATDAAGRFAFDGLLPGECRVTCEARDFLRQGILTANLESGETSTMTIILERGIPWEGRVVFDDGTPAPGVAMQFFVRGSNGVAWEVWTDADGRFRTEAAPRGGPIQLYVIDYSDPEFSPVTFEAESVAELPRDITVMRCASLELRIRVKGDREPPANIDVAVADVAGGDRRPFRGPVATKVSLVAGKGVLQCVAPGAKRVTVSAPLFPLPAVVDAVLTSGQLTTLELTLDGTGQPTFVHVVDADGEPVAQAQVLVTHARASDEPHWSMNRSEEVPRYTDSAGRAVIHGLEQTRADVAVLARGFAPSTIRNAGSRIVDGELRVELAPEARLRVVMRDATGGPVEGLEIKLRWLEFPELSSKPDAWYPGDPVHITQPDGAAAITGLRAGPHEIRIEKDRRAIGTLETSLVAGEETVVEHSMGSQLSVRGAVRVNGRRMATGIVWFATEHNNTRAPVESDGSYETELAAGSYSVSYSLNDDFSCVLFGGTHEVGNTDTVLDLDLEAARVSGRMLFHDGRPAAHVRFEVHGAATCRMNADEDGRFTIPFLSHGFATFQPHDDDGLIAPALILCVSGTEMPPIEYRFDRPVTLRLTLADGRAPKGMGIAEIGPDTGKEYVRWRRVDGDDSYIEVDWRTGARAGLVTAPDGRGAFFEWDPEQGDQVEVGPLRPTGRAKFAVRSRDGSPALGFTMLLTGAGADGAAFPARRVLNTLGDTYSLTMPAGTYAADVRLANGAVARASFEIRAGAETPVEIIARE